MCVSNLASTDLLNEFLTKIHEVLESPLVLANRNIKVHKDKNDQLKSEENFRIGDCRFLEDYFLTIADIIVFYFLTLILNKCKEVARELENNYSLICLW